MKTYNRICIKDFEISDGDRILKLKRGKEYLTSKIENNKVVVFTNYWASVPANIFAGEKIFTNE